MCWHPGKGLSPVRETALPVGMHTIIRRLETYRQYPGNIYSFQHKEHTIKQCKTLHLYLNYIPFGYEWLTCSISGCLFRKIIIIIIILPWTPEGVPLPFPSRIVCFLAEWHHVAHSENCLSCFSAYHIKFASSLTFSIPYTSLSVAFVCSVVLTQYLPTACFNVVVD